MNNAAVIGAGLLCLSFLLSPSALVGQETAAKGGALEKRIAVLQDKRINESSGLALGIRDPSIFWTLNDSGGEPCIFAVDHRSGKTRAKVRLRDAANFDWEDIDSYRDPDGKGWIFVADIGDNFLTRPSIQIYQIPEPELPPEDKVDKETESAKPRIWHMLYPDRLRNAESIFVHPKTGQLFIVTKHAAGHSEVFAVPTTFQEGKAMTLEKIASLEFPATPRLGKRPKDACQTTGASLSPNGEWLVIATYSHFHEWKIERNESIASALQRKTTAILEAPALPQLEGVCYDADNRSLWCTSEHLPTPLYKITR